MDMTYTRSVHFSVISAAVQLALGGKVSLTHWWKESEEDEGKVS